MDFKEYLSLDRWGSSSLKSMRRGPPARVLWDRSRPHEHTPATLLGSAVHCEFITPELFPSQFDVKPDGMSFATKEGKAWRVAPERAGREILSFEQSEQVKQIVGALRSKWPVVMARDTAEAREHTLLWECAGELCKGRPDWLGGGYIYDLKVSRHAGGGYLSQCAYREGWMHQLAFYRDGARRNGLRVDGGRLVVVDPSPPHFVHMLEVKPDALDLLQLQNEETLSRMGKCREADFWPGTPNEWTLVEPPPSAEVIFEDGDDNG